MAPSRIGRYEIQRRLGTGGMGSLYLARDPSLDRLVAIKLLRDDFHDDPELRARFTREARSVARLRHPNIIIVHDVGDHEGRPFMAMEYVAGETLTHVLRRKPPMPLLERVALVEDLCAGLAHAHAAGIVHRDIKPANVMIDGHGVLKILDFGIARLTNSGMTQDGMMLGSVNYMSPEQVVGRGVDHRTDIFAAGAVLYEMIALEQAFPGGIDSGVLHRILHVGPVPVNTRVPGLDPDLARIVDRALDRDPAQRYDDIDLMRRDLARVRRRLLESGDVAAMPPPADRTAIVRPKTDPSRPPDSDRPRRLDPQRFAELRRQQLDEHLQRGDAAFASGDHEAAVHHAERAASIDPECRNAYDLIDRARLEIDGKTVRQLLTNARQLVAKGRLEEAAALAERALAAVPDLPGAAPLRSEALELAGEIEGLRQREQRIATSLERARTSLDRGGYETALRAIYEALALDPDRTEARELEQAAQAGLHAKRDHEQARRVALERLKLAHTIALEGRFDEAERLVGSIAPPSDTVRLAASEALDTIRKLQRQAAQTAAVAQARGHFDDKQYDRALAALESIPDADRTDEARAVHRAVRDAIAAERELAEKRRQLESGLAAVTGLIDAGDLAAALERLEAAARIGLPDQRIAPLRERIADLAVAVQERRRQEARDALAERTVDAARRMFGKGEQAAALALLERDRTGHAQIAATLDELRQVVAEQEKRAREDAERQRREEEARHRREEEARQRREDEALRQAEAEAARAREEARRADIAARVADAERALEQDRLSEAAAQLARVDAVGPVDDGAALIARATAVKVEIERRERLRAAITDHLSRSHQLIAQGELEAARGAADAALELDARNEAARTIRDEIDAEIRRQEEERRQLENARARIEQEQIEQERIRQERIEQERIKQERIQQERIEQERVDQQRRRAEEQRVRLELEAKAAESAPLDATLIPTGPAADPASQPAPTIVRSPTAPSRAPVPSRTVDARRLAAAAAVLVALGGGAYLLRDLFTNREPRPETSGPSRSPEGATGAVPVAPEPAAPVPPPSSTLPSAPEPAPPQVAPAPEATVPVAKPDPRAARVEEQLRGHRRRARDLLTDAPLQALAEIQAALQLRPDDAESRSMLGDLAAAARTRLYRAKQEAQARNAADLAPEAYQAAGSLEANADEERRSGRVDRAVQLWLDAAGGFSAAADQATRVAAARQREVERPTQAPAAPPPTPAAPTPAPAQPSSRQAPAPQTPVSRTDAEQPAILRTLRAYEEAWASLDAGAIARVHQLSSSELSTVRSSVEAARRIEVAVSVQNVSVSADGRRARVAAEVRRTFIPKSAARPSNSTVNTVLTLEKQGDAWIIVALR